MMDRNENYTDVLSANGHAAASGAATAHGRGRPKSAKPKIQFTARFDADLVNHFRAGGKGWLVRMENTLRKAIAAGL